MCGISGIVGEVDNIEGMLTRMSKAFVHRGPDHSDVWSNLFVDAQIGMAHSQLKIVDMSEAAHQPMVDDDTGLVIVFDGRIYNSKEIRKSLESHYTFKTNSDTEVLLKAYHRWGRNCMDHLNGMFAFAIYDRSAQSLFIARDRFGMKPMYFSLQKGNFYFASEIKALFAAGIRKQPAEKQWANYLVYASYGMPYETFWDNVFQLPGGHYLYFDGFSLDIKRWYDFDERVMSLNMPEKEEQVLDQFINLADGSIRDHLNADVPLGINLSGGFDSSLLLGLIHKHSDENHFKVFSFYCGDKHDDEILWTYEMLSHTNYELEQVQITPKMVLNEASRVVRMQDEPFDGLGTIAYTHLFKMAHKRGMKVLCDGHGLDEVWSDYTGGGFKRGCPPSSPRFLSVDFMRLAHKHDYPRPFQNEFDNLRYRDLFYTQLPHILRFNDRASMTYSTELRKPFLDHRLVEFAFAVPDHLRVRNHQDKWIPRRYASTLLPNDVRLAPQQTVCMPQQDWFIGPLREWVDEAVEQLENGKVSSWFDHKKLESEWHNYQQGRVDNDCHIWRWVNLAMMLRP